MPSMHELSEVLFYLQDNTSAALRDGAYSSQFLFISHIACIASYRIDNYNCKNRTLTDFTLCK